MSRPWGGCSKTFPKPKKFKRPVELPPGETSADTLGLGLHMCDVQFKIENKRNYRQVHIVSFVVVG